MSGSFVGVAGPSGSGKDAVLDYAQARLSELVAGPGAGAGLGAPSADGSGATLADGSGAGAGAGTFEFAQRVITREPGLGEHSEYATPEQFRTREAAGGFALSWHAHGLDYGIPASTTERVQAGVVVIGNVSRGVLDTLPSRFTRSHTVLITVPDEVRKARIAARGREGEAAARARVDRPNPAPDFAFDLEIVNDRTIAEAGEQLVAFLLRVAAG